MELYNISIPKTYIIPQLNYRQQNLFAQFVSIQLENLKQFPDVTTNWSQKEESPNKLTNERWKMPKTYFIPQLNYS